MSIKEKAKAYDDALEKARKELQTCGSTDCDAARQILRFFPQLRESEDEKIRRELIEFIQWSEDRGMTRHDFHQAKRPAEWIAYLEKQKEWKPALSEEDERVVKFLKHAATLDAADELFQEYGVKHTQVIAWLEKQKENPKSADSIPADCTSDAKCEDRSPKHSDSDGTDIRDTPAYWRGWDDAMKQKEQKHPNGCFTCDEYKKGYEEGRRNGFTAGYNKAMKEVEQKEQKPNYCHYGGDPNVERCKYCSAACSARLTEEQKPEWSEEDKMYLSQAIETLEHENYLVLAEKLKSLRPQPKQEWSEEDERMLSRCIKSIESSKQFANSDTFKKAKDKEINWLKNRFKFLSLQSKEDCNYITPNKEFFQWIYDRLVHVHKENPDVDYMMSFKERINNLSFEDKPHWKPSEAHLSALLAIISDPNNIGSQTCQLALTDLYEQLKAIKEDKK